MSGIEVRLSGNQMDTFIGSLVPLADTGPVVVGGLAVMCRLGAEHRVTLDVDSTFDRPDDPPTAAMLVAEGIATPGGAIQRVMVGGTLVDVIDTFEIDESELPDDDKSRLFVCAHRYAWETGEPVTFVGDSTAATLAVATVEALIAMKAHALRFGSRERRRRKRGSDLYDLLLLSQITDGPLLVDAPWGLANQVHEALAIDLADHGSLAATLKVSGPPGSQRFTTDTAGLFVERLLGRLQPPTTADRHVRRIQRTPRETGGSGAGGRTGD